MRSLFKKSFFINCYNIFIIIITGVSRIYLIFLVDFLEICNERIIFKKKFKLIFKNYISKKSLEIAEIVNFLEKPPLPHTNREVYQPYNEVSKKAVYDCFVEAYF